MSTHGEAQRRALASRAGRGDPATQSSQPSQPNRARTARRAAEPARHAVSLKQGLAWGLAVASVLMLTLAGAGLPPRLIWNTSGSAPAGLYWIDYGGWTRGDRVAVRPGERLAADLEARGVLPRDRLLIKRIIASSGDTVCRNETAISVNGAVLARAREQDSHGRLLPKWEGCITLTADEVFLLGDGPGSYDGRYFGVTKASEVIGRVSLLVEF